MRPKYVRMIEQMNAKDEGSTDEPWVLYILRCSGDTFYTGVTKDLERRLKMHTNGKASKYTRVRLPVELIYSEHCGSRAKALMREYEVKKLSRRQKEQLIAAKPEKG